MFNKMYTCISKLCGLSRAPNNDWEKQVKEDLEGDNETFYDAEGGSNHQIIDLNVTMGERVKTIEELYREEVDKETYEELQLLRCDECCRSSEAQNNVMRELVSTLKKLQKKVDGNQEFDVIKKYQEDRTILNVLEELTNNTNEIKNQISSIERNTEKLNTKYGLLKARLANLEKESMENSMQILGMDYSTRALLWLRPNFDERAAVQFAENGFGRSQPHYPQQPVAPTAPADFVPTHSISRPPPPPPPGTSAFGSPTPPPPPTVTSAFVPPPPPPPPPVSSAFAPMTTGTTTAPWNKLQATAVSSPPAAAPEGTAQKMYGRIVITEDLLKSVVLKPPGQRKAGNRIPAKI